MSIKKNSDGDLVIRHVIPAAYADEWIEAAAVKQNYDTNKAEGESKRDYIDRMFKHAHRSVLATERIKKQAVKLMSDISKEVEIG